ncbi:Cerato-platanin [Dichomitus squalens LYAD-421 SS1]|uniref:Cerato-platanin n=1 Tax=Dichomitus squalens (strain LYAD-421) TaxID=732165 RepID=UPI0004413B8D|nr:Cerato-platanin [Dichomitus squalens LYAD-421 SS1]EJF62732.1 Cerato-platanin [Dichomitus squalens LYAD-421 SS1]
MQIKPISFSLAALLAPAALGATTSTSVSVSYDPAYDNGPASLSTVSCSDGSHGLLTKGYTTFDSLPSFPNIGGTSAVPGWNSDQCGTCWSLAYNGTTIHVLAVDSTENGWNVALQAMNTLTGGQAQQLGRVDAVATLVNSSLCGL